MTDYPNVMVDGMTVSENGQINFNGDELGRLLANCNLRIMFARVNPTDKLTDNSLGEIRLYNNSDQRTILTIQQATYSAFKLLAERLGMSDYKASELEYRLY